MAISLASAARVLGADRGDIYGDGVGQRGGKRREILERETNKRPLSSISRAVPGKTGLDSRVIY